MPKSTLTTALVQFSSCPAEKKRIEIFDNATPGLSVEIRSSGNKTYYFRYRDQRGKQRQYRIGDVKSITLEQAKKAVNHIRGQIAMGIDPAAEKAVLRQIPTFAAFINERYLPFVKGYKKSWEADDSYLRNHLLPALGKKHLDEISKHDVIQFHHGMKAKQYALGTCNRCLILLRYAMNLAIRWEIPGIQTNPTKDVPLFEDPDGQKERYLTSEVLLLE